MSLPVSETSSDSRGYVADCALLIVGGGALLIALILWFDNAQGGLTGNGFFKSIELKPWITDPANAPLYAANYLYYPLHGVLCRGLDLLGVFPGDPRRQLTILNALAATGCLCVVYLLVRALTGDRVLALLTALFHIACNFVLLLAITNEDIMPSYTVMLASMALASLWFARPTPDRVALVAAVFSLGWLFEWRLMFPTLPAMLAALWLCEPRLLRRLGWIALFLAVMGATAVVTAVAWSGHKGAVGALELLWTGKAVDSAWAGLAWAKVGYLADGIAGYLLGTAITRSEGGWDIWRYAAILAMAALALAAAPALWRTRREPRTRALAAVFGGTFVAGEVFNLYSQPQDPQMQINVMAWLVPAWALAVALLAYNLWSLAPLRGRDTAWQRSFDNIEHRTDPARTVFLVHVFDWMVMYASVQTGPPQFGTDGLGPAPQAQPKFKWIGFAHQALWHPDWPIEKQVADMKGQIDRALDLGYQVLAVRLWELDQFQLEKDTNMIAGSDKVAALRAMLHRDYTATPAFDDPIIGKVDRLQRAR